MQCEEEVRWLKWKGPEKGDDGVSKRPIEEELHKLSKKMVLNQNMTTQYIHYPTTEHATVC